MEELQLKKIVNKFDETVSIICQKQKDTGLTSTANGQTRVREAAEIYQDMVWVSLKSVDKDLFIMYASKEIEQSYGWCIIYSSFSVSSYNPAHNILELYNILV